MQRVSGTGSIGEVDPGVDVREVLNQAGDIIYCVDLEGRFTYCNRAGFDLFGIPFEERRDWLGRSFADLLAPESRRVAVEHFRRAIEDQEITPFFEVEGVRPDGTLVQLEVRASSIRRDGRLVGRQGVARDITELKRLQAEVREKSARLELLESQGRLAMEIYRRITQLALDAPDDPAAADGALRKVSETLSESAAAQLGLDSRDVAIIGLLASGRSNRQIAETVYLSPNTVKDRISKIMRALGAKRRAEVVAEASRRGLISFSAATPP
jgi:PAS domain S-box-containing protein